MIFSAQPLWFAVPFGAALVVNTKNTVNAVNTVFLLGAPRVLLCPAVNLRPEPNHTTAQQAQGVYNGAPSHTSAALSRITPPPQRARRRDIGADVSATVAVTLN